MNIKTSVRNNSFIIYLFFIVVIGLVIRLYKFDNPIADWHSWRQVDTAAVARNFVDFGFDPLRPRYDDLSNIQSGKDNPQGYRMVEFPLYQSISYVLFKIFPVFSIEQSLRVVSITASLITMVSIAFLVKRIHTSLSGIFAAFSYAIFPYSVFYGRSILPEPLMVCLAVVSILATMVGFEKQGKIKFFLLLSGALFASLSLLVKPFAVFLLLPVAFFWIRHLTDKKTMVLGIMSALIAILPLYWWRNWIMNFPEGIPVSSWLFNEGNIRFKGAWFHWLFAERISKLILGYWGIGLLILGFVSKIHRTTGLLSLLVTGSLAYMVIIARGNVQHDYYQQLLLPILFIIVGIGAGSLFEQKNLLQKGKNGLLVLILLLFSVAFSWFEIRGFYWINRPEIVEAGTVANELLPKNAKVIAPYNGDTTFLYQTKRQGWPLGFDIEKKIAQGATHYVTVSPTDADGETKDLAERYTVIVRNESFAIIDLTNPKGSL